MEITGRNEGNLSYFSVMEIYITALFGTKYGLRETKKGIVSSPISGVFAAGFLLADPSKKGVERKKPAGTKSFLPTRHMTFPYIPLRDSELHARQKSNKIGINETPDQPRMRRDTKRTLSYTFIGIPPTT